jgi:phage I-like protein
MAGFETAVFDQGAAIGDAPEWVHLLPAGNIQARDGRSFVLKSPDVVIQAFRAGAIDLPIDYQHQNDRKDTGLSGPVPAAGWIKELCERDGEIWGRVAWTDQARDMIRKREYRFISPTIIFDKDTREIARIKGAGLVHNPALHLVALASQENPMAPVPTFLARLAKMLDLPEDATDDDIMNALAERIKAPDPRKFAPIETLQELMRERSNGLATLSAERAEAKVTDALSRGYLTPAMRNWATELCKTDEAAFDIFMKTALPSYAMLSQQIVPATPPGQVPQGSYDPDTLAICAQLGLTPDKLHS